MTYKDTIDQLLTSMGNNTNIKSTGYGDPTAYDVSKNGFEYSRAYLSLIDADDNYYSLELVVTDKPLVDGGDRLIIESSTLTTIKQVAKSFKALNVVKFDNVITYKPTMTYQRDQTVGWKIEFKVKSNEVIKCN